MLSFNALSYPSLGIKVDDISLGTVNGKYINNTVEIKKTISNTVLFSIKNSDVKQNIRMLDIQNAKFRKYNNGRNSIAVDIEDSTGIITHLELILLRNGRKVDISPMTVGSNLSITVPKEFSTLDLKIVNPIVMFVPRNYKGYFSIPIIVNGIG